MIGAYPKPITIEGTKRILNQMENCICQIHNKEGEKGTGFFCTIPSNTPSKSIQIMITNYHIIDEKFLKENKEIKISLNDEKEERIIVLNDRKIYANEKYDITIIEIKKEKDNINNFLEIDKDIFEKTNVFYNNQSIYVIQYPFNDKISVSYGVINNINEYTINHYCSTKSGSLCSPIINLLNHKIIGMHKEGTLINKGIYLKYPINEFLNEYKNKTDNIKIIPYKESKEIKVTSPNLINVLNKEIGKKQLKVEKDLKSLLDQELKVEKDIKNEIEIELKVNKEEINSNIYFLDNTNYIEENTCKNHYHDNLKELNSQNVDLYINDNKQKYEKYFKPDKEGVYKIKLIFKNYMKDCSFMFAGCKNINNINFNNFKTKHVVSMRYMFTGCTNLEKLDLSSFDTKNVIDMEGMFGQYDNLSKIDFCSINPLKSPKDLEIIYYYGCEKLKEINLSSFDTKNVTNMSFMFSSCNNLTNLDLSSFDTKNVTNMNGMFGICNNLTELKLSSFNTKNVTNMSYMFFACEKLENLDLSSFDTKNVTNMYFMFGVCKNLINLNLSSFNTKNVSNMAGMLAICINLSNLNLSSFDTKNVTNMSYMFFGCENLNNLELSSFDTKNVNNVKCMFCGIKNISKSNLSAFKQFDENEMIEMCA